MARPGRRRQNAGTGRETKPSDVAPQRSAKDSRHESASTPSQADPGAARAAPAVPIVANPEVAAGTSTSLLDLLSGPRGSAGLALAGLTISLASLLTTTSITRIAVLGPVAFACLVWIAWRQKKRLLGLGALVLCLLSVLLTVRAYSRPPTLHTYYSGAVLDYSEIPYQASSVPLTDDPDRGFTYAELGPGNATELEFSCTRNGVISTDTRSTDMDWAQIIGGPYRTLWAPMSFVRGLAVGQARTLLPCSNWRWELQHLGRT